MEVEMVLYLAVLRRKAREAYLEMFPGARINALVSYGRRDPEEMSLLGKDRGSVDRLIGDSGTWSLNQNRQKYADWITITGYIPFLRVAADKLDFYFNFDEDFSKDGFDTNLAHQLRLEEEGFKPVPVIHDCYGDEIQYYIDRGHKMLAIGSGELAYASLDEMHFIMERFRKHGIKVHFLGCTDYMKLAYLPVYSCDSSSWTQAGARDYALFWNPARSGFNKTDKVFLTETPSPKMKGQHHLDHPFRVEFQEYLHREFGFSIEDLVGKKSKVTVNRQVVNIRYFLELGARATAKQQELGFTFE